MFFYRNRKIRINGVGSIFVKRVTTTGHSIRRGQCWHCLTAFSIKLFSVLSWPPNEPQLYHYYHWPRGRPRTSDVSPPPVWNLWAIIWFHSWVCSLVILPSPVAHSFFSFFLRLAHSLSYFPQMSFNCLFLLVADRIFCMALGFSFFFSG